MIAIKRQVIRDTSGTPIGVLLPIEEFALIEDVLVERANLLLSDEEKLQRLERAMSDPLFKSDLEETMADFSIIDQEFWEMIE